MTAEPGAKSRPRPAPWWVVTSGVVAAWTVVVAADPLLLLLVLVLGGAALTSTWARPFAIGLVGGLLSILAIGTWAAGQLSAG